MIRWNFPSFLPSFLPLRYMWFDESRKSNSPGNWLGIPTGCATHTYTHLCVTMLARAWTGGGSPRSMIWSLCASVDEEGRQKMDNFVREMEGGGFPLRDTVYEYYVDVRQRGFVSWEEKLSSAWKFQPGWVDADTRAAPAPLVLSGARARRDIIQFCPTFSPAAEEFSRVVMTRRKMNNFSRFPRTFDFTLTLSCARFKLCYIYVRRLLSPRLTPLETRRVLQIALFGRGVLMLCWNSTAEHLFTR